MFNVHRQYYLFWEFASTLHICLYTLNFVHSHIHLTDILYETQNIEYFFLNVSFIILEHGNGGQGL